MSSIERNIPNTPKSIFLSYKPSNRCFYLKWRFSFTLILQQFGYDPISTSRIEELALKLKEKYAIIIVTHNMQQAVRISDNTAFFLLGELVEFGETEKLFSQPQDKRTEDYITGRFG